MVNEAKTNIEKYTAARVEYEEKITESSDTIKSIREEMANCDELLQELRPGLKLDTLEERCMYGWLGVWGIGYGVLGMEYGVLGLEYKVLGLEYESRSRSICSLPPQIRSWNG